MAETDIRIKDAPLTGSISGGMKIPISDGSNLPKTTSITQLYNFVKSGLLNTDGFALKANIPTKTSQLINDSGFATTSQIPNAVSKLTNDSGFITEAALTPYAKAANVPTKVSQLTNDSKFVSSDVTDTLAQSIAQNSGDIERLIESKDQLGEAKAISLDTEKWPTMTGLPIMREGDGAPAVIPDFVGQKYADLTNRKLYFAFGVSSVSDWVVMN